MGILIILQIKFCKQVTSDKLVENQSLLYLLVDVDFMTDRNVYCTLRV